jgi:hypothetical protein
MQHRTYNRSFASITRSRLVDIISAFGDVGASYSVALVFRVFDDPAECAEIIYPDTNADAADKGPMFGCAASGQSSLRTHFVGDIQCGALEPGDRGTINLSPRVEADAQKDRPVQI